MITVFVKSLQESQSTGQYTPTCDLAHRQFEKEAAQFRHSGISTHILGILELTIPELSQFLLHWQWYADFMGYISPACTKLLSVISSEICSSNRLI